METSHSVERIYKRLKLILLELNETLNEYPCKNLTEDQVPRPSKDDYAFLYIVFVMVFFAITVGGLVIGYTRSKKGEKLQDAYYAFTKSNSTSEV